METRKTKNQKLVFGEQMEQNIQNIILKIHQTIIELINSSKESTRQLNNIFENIRKEYELIEKVEEENQEEIEKIKKQIEIANRMKILTVKEQMKKVEGLLKDVSIEFNEVDEKTGELKDIYHITYKGREYEQCSKSEQMKADLEIAYLMNMATGIKAPNILDDVESITNIEVKNKNQILLSMVVKYEELEILCNYNEVLKRLKNSVEKQLEDNNQLINQAA